MVKAWKETVTIPTYEVGKPEKNPIFLENRVYQGSSGVVYPYPVIEKIADTKTDHDWQAVFLENEYIKVMILPELGGRIQMAYDKIKKRHFVYYNHVIKPALVGLAGPWISGGIEFNWPQHHRPSTYMPVDCDIRENTDGSVTVMVSELERMFGQKGMASFTLRPGIAFLEIKGQLYNPTDMPQTFLWWANPAVAVNEYYRSVFPPDINAVFDHGKRAVSTFPIATGTYYKMDYSAGVDIANYKNIFVPTSYMGVNSKYDFEGGYECDTQAGMLHVASHHISPGKKQWTWGNGDFGRAWDRNLTDEDGPYIELMAGVFTENQPDFSWLMPYEEKQFTQYFLPYRELGMVKCATKDLLLAVEPETQVGESSSGVRLKIFATSHQNVTISVKTASGVEVFIEETEISPERIFSAFIPTPDTYFEDLCVEIRDTLNKKSLLKWSPEPDEIKPIPDAAEAALRPEEIKTNDQLYLTGLHLEQYRHATFSPVDYYEEALRRDPDDYRCNNALGLWYIRKCRFELSEKYLRRAAKTITRRNPNPYDGEPIFNLAVALKRQGKLDEAYELFHKATWNAGWKDAAFLEAAKISSIRERYEDALEEVEQSLIRNSHNNKALSLKAAVESKLGRISEAIATCREALALDQFNFTAQYLIQTLSCDTQGEKGFVALMNGSAHNYNQTALEFSDMGFYGYALDVLDLARENNSLSLMGLYYRGYSESAAGKQPESFSTASKQPTDLVFPNNHHDVQALEAALHVNPDDANAHYLLGNLYYDKRQYEIAMKYWKRASELNPEYPTVFRNLALGYFNKSHDEELAVINIEKAFALDKTDSRVLMELDQLYKRIKRPARVRLELLDKHEDLVMQRDDLILEKITLLNILGRHEDAMNLLDSHIFHPWEGGEGKVPFQYQTSRVELAKVAMAEERYEDALKLLEECLEYPHHLGEGKLYGAQENDFNYLLGICHESLGNMEKARECRLKATEGPTEPAAAMYYNDAKPDKIFYAGLAFRALGLEDKARAYFNRLVNYGKQHYHDKVLMDYFAVSLPDLLIWDGDLDEANRKHCLYMLTLGYTGLEDRKHAEKYMNELLAIDPYHQGALSLLTLKSKSFFGKN